MKVDDHTVDFVLPGPNPILHYEWDTWYIMSKKWAEANNSPRCSRSGQQMSYAALNANGTGPFMLDEPPGRRAAPCSSRTRTGGASPSTISTRSIFTTIKSTRRASPRCSRARSTWIDPVPLQDVRAHQCAAANAEVLQGPELRTIFLGLDQMRDELQYSNVKGKNPFKDVRVRQAFYQAIDDRTRSTSA